MKKKFFGAAALGAVSLALLGGCAAQDQVSSTTMEQATQPLTCMSKAECDAWWARAQVWVTNHSEYRIQTITDSIIMTAGPSSGKRALAYQITKTPTNEGTATIGFAAHCDNPLGCEPNPWQAGADFKQFIRNGPALRQMTTPQAGVAPQAAPTPSGVQVSPLTQPVPLNLESQPGQSATPLTPQ
ncbi:hypothetical protein [Caballeronia ptereochthonis]|uniref:Lipoprotein n=1 Tax=Caballeronia ptereochthonis TaxID=1777144 RepID=A0A158BT00_9BURK|nr:hypothetical protein [Caballeronia ptereochthonis]SAK73228.1 hypothetical protein AWB83_03602 [Caballeronia ptereochthonis]